MHFLHILPILCLSTKKEDVTCCIIMNLRKA